MPPYLGDYAQRLVNYEKQRSALVTERTSGFDSIWRDLGDYINPMRVRFTTSDRNRNIRKNQYIIDSTARFSARTLASGLHAGLTSPARPWMKLTTPDATLAELPQVKAWLSLVTSRMLVAFATSNLYNILPLVYGDMGTFATGAMSILPDSRDLFRCYSYPLGSYAVGQDKRGLTSTFVREYPQTVRQIVEEFGVQADGRTIKWDNISTATHALWDSSDYEKPVNIVWIVKRNDYADSTKLASKFLPFESCYYEKGENEGKFLRESGFKTFPVMAPRWDITGEDSYGTDCPGMMALGDVKQLQTMQRRKGQAIAKQVDPPLSGPSSLRTQKTSLLPGDVTYVDVREGMQGLRAIHEVNLNLGDMTTDIGQVQYRIQRCYFEDLFLMLARSDDMRGMQPITAREVDERHEEKLLALGPVLERTNDELLDPIVDRVFGMMMDAGLFPPAPHELEGVALKVEYVSILAQAQKLVGVVGQDRFLQSVQVLAEAFPEVRHKIDAFQVVDNYADMLGVDPRLVKTNDVATGELQQAAQQAAVTQRAEQAVQLAKAGKLAAETPLSGDSVLNRITQNATTPAGQVFASPASANPAPLPATN